MASIEMVYLAGLECEYNGADLCLQCFTCSAGDMGCPWYNNGETDSEAEVHHIPFGDCKRGKILYAWKGWSGENYEIKAPSRDPYNPHLDSMEVRIGRKAFDAVKVRLNGRIIFNNLDDETDEEGKE